MRAEAATLPIAPPSPFLFPLEGRAWLELAALAPAWPFLRRAPRGDGHPVLVLPGWLATDLSTRALRAFLRARGYHVHGWRLGRNLGPSAELIDGLVARFRELRERHGRPLSIIGWSLGGIYARELARRNAADVRRVITLGSPFRDPYATTAAARLFGHRGRPVDAERQHRLRTPPPVPCTSFYSRTDGIVAWQSCLEEARPWTENVEVRSSHCGMGHHPTVLLAIAERLARPAH
ncbi:MAG TPA: alpha/beta hydrolase [Candidatus Binatia bacterium]|jgi:pimeloyl-ACP methyl ester carboxylesterase